MLEVIYLTTVVVLGAFWFYVCAVEAMDWWIYGGGSQARTTLTLIFGGGVAVVFWPLALLVLLGYLVKDAIVGDN